jgi:hypothetical protein
MAHNLIVAVQVKSLKGNSKNGRGHLIYFMFLSHRCVEKLYENIEDDVIIVNSQIFCEISSFRISRVK